MTSWSYFRNQSKRPHLCSTFRHQHDKSVSIVPGEVRNTDWSLQFASCGPMIFKKILCGVDFSQPSLRAFQTAVQLARQSKAELHLLHVIEAQPVVPGLV